ncbi:MAG: hypothetical protein KDD10_17130 [Phaeodactylibacter sp.]|nr:hypothetical protein [Phaeodactylibacter sp.]MCB9292570.1 hypothetical protein [Lewinellaceae bacterium]
MVRYINLVFSLPKQAFGFIRQAERFHSTCLPVREQTIVPDKRFSFKFSKAARQNRNFIANRKSNWRPIARQHKNNRNIKLVAVSIFFYLSGHTIETTTCP